MTDTKWIVDRAKSHIRFKVKHMMIANVQGEFLEYRLGFETEGEKFATANIDFVIDTESINTNSEKRDKHLKSKDFFDTSNHPSIIFKSKKIEEQDDNKYLVTGTLNIKDVTKEIEFMATLSKIVTDRHGVTRKCFNFEMTLNRLDYGLDWNKVLVTENWALVGDKVQIDGNMELVNEGSVKPHIPPSLGFGNKTLTQEKHFIYTTYKGDLDGSFLWHGNTGKANHWIFGSCTGDTKETKHRAVKVKQHIENTMREYTDIESPAQFLRILHDFVEHDPFLAYSFNEKSGFSMDVAYVIVDPETRTALFASARMAVRLINPKGGKYFSITNISLGYPYYNIGKLTDHEIKFNPGDQLVIHNEELSMQHGGSQRKRLGKKGAAAVIQDNMNFSWEDRADHMDHVVKKWAGKNTLEDIALIQIQL
ncbi:MAG: YceI family protein [bacterium]|nr:YceI family protein [bacterium]